MIDISRVGHIITILGQDRTTTAAAGLRDSASTIASDRSADEDDASCSLMVAPRLLTWMPGHRPGPLILRAATLQCQFSDHARAPRAGPGKG
jgi:hypothetical protein